MGRVSRNLIMTLTRPGDGPVNVKSPTSSKSPGASTFAAEITVRCSPLPHNSQIRCNRGEQTVVKAQGWEFPIAKEESNQPCLRHVFVSLEHALFFLHTKDGTEPIRTKWGRVPLIQPSCSAGWPRANHPHSLRCFDPRDFAVIFETDWFLTERPVFFPA